MNLRYWGISLQKYSSDIFIQHCLIRHILIEHSLCAHLSSVLGAEGTMLVFSWPQGASSLMGTVIQTWKAAWTSVHLLSTGSSPVPTSVNFETKLWPQPHLSFLTFLSAVSSCPQVLFPVFTMILTSLPYRLSPGLCMFSLSLARSLALCVCVYAHVCAVNKMLH